MKKVFFLFLILQQLFGSCSTSDTTKETTSSALIDREVKTRPGNFEEGGDYQVFERVRFMDKEGFEVPTEAYSMLFPKGWSYKGDITWRQPGSPCPGTFQELKAQSPDGQYQFEFLPVVTYVWSDNAQLMQMQKAGGACTQAHEPVEAESYLRNIFVKELGNPQIISVESNPHALAQIQESNEANRTELQGYGAGRIAFNQTAINARVKWENGQEGMITLAVTIMQSEVPNVYGGPSAQIYTTSIQRTLFKYPAAKSDAAEKSYVVILSSVRTNPGWKNAVQGFWKEVRMQRNVTHRAVLRATDEATAAMTRSHEERMRNIQAQGESNTRNWEARQSAQDRMHTEFIKTIRGVENYRDESGKYEMTSGYDHVWSRGDGNSFIMSNNPNFDPSSAFRDQNWKQMKKVD